MVDRRRAEAIADLVDRRVEREAARPVERQDELDLLDALEVRDGDADEASAHAAGSSARSLRGAPGRWRGRPASRGRPRKRVGPGRAREVVEAKPQDDGAPDPPRTTHPPRDAVDEPGQRRVDLVVRPAASRRARAATRSSRVGDPPARGGDRDCARARGYLAAGGPADHQDERLLQAGAASPTVRMPRAWSFAARRRRPASRRRAAGGGTRAPRRGAQRAARRAWRPRSPPWRGTRPRDADRDRQADVLPDVAAQPRCDLGRRPGEALHAAHVEERPRRSRAPRRAGSRPRTPGTSICSPRVGGHPRPDDDRVRAEPPAWRPPMAVRTP